MFKKIYNEDCEVYVGKKVTLQEGVVLGPKCRKIDIGFGSFIGRDVYIDVEELIIGEYTTIHHGSILHGIKTTIGHNCWFGHYTIIDSLGGNTVIGNNVGVGAHSQLWSHMKFGDVLAGCRWNSSLSILLGDDVWLVGHSIIGPIIAEPKSMLLTGSVMTKRMKENKIYSGSPAKGLTKLGGQFNSITIEEKREMFNELLNSYAKEYDCDISKFVEVNIFDLDCHNEGLTQFDLESRTYLPQYTTEEFNFIKYLLYDKAKFVPHVIEN